MKQSTKRRKAASRHIPEVPSAKMPFHREVGEGGRRGQSRF
jgi:hypothetical protein